MPKRKRVLTPSQIQKGNDRNKTNYDRISFFAPKSLKVKERIKANSSSLNNYVLQAVLTSLEKDEKPVTAAAARSDIAPREAAAPVPSSSDDIPLTALDLSENDFKTLFLNNCHTVKDVKNTISALSSTDITADLYTRVSTAAIDYLNAHKTD